MPLLEHGEHASCHREAAEDVDARKQHRDRREHLHDEVRGDDLHDRENASIAQTKREAAQKREVTKARREKRNNRVVFATPFSTDEYAEEQDLMQHLRR